MKPEDFATQFFDLWQQSASQMMHDPAFNQKMLDLMQQSIQQWQQTNPMSAYAPAFSHATDDDADPVSVDELASRLEQCERQIRALEILVQHCMADLADLAAEAATGKPAAE